MTGWRSNLARCCVLVALVVLLASHIAPALDHHALERVPYHRHAVPVQHDHSRSLTYPHDDWPTERPGPLAGATVLPDRDGQAPTAAADSGIIAFSVRAILAGAASNPTPPLTPGRGRRPADPFSEPPDHPPRA
jgi:hypothetical protein